MSDWKGQLRSAKRKIEREKTLTLTLPPTFAFKRQGAIDFDSYLKFFDWSVRDRPVRVDFTKCKSANYQALSLLVLYLWELRKQGCRITPVLDNEASGASSMWRLMGAQALFQVSTDDAAQFVGNDYKPLIAIRNSDDFKKALATAEKYTKEFDVEYTNTLRYVLSELLYNTLEHGSSYFEFRGTTKKIPSIIQFTWYQTRNEIDFVVGDIGVGVRRHLSSAYPGIESDEEAIRLAVRPRVSGTFLTGDIYKAKDNAGVGLYISTNIVRRLGADMYIVSGNGVLHVSPRDVTSKTLNYSWPGTFVVVTIRVEENVKFALHSMMQEFREAADAEQRKGEQTERQNRYYLHVANLVGPYAEDKKSAINIRDRKLLPAIREGKAAVIDFEGVESAPHSFLSALFAVPVQEIGMLAYKRIKIVNANPEIRETVDFIFDENTE